MGARGAGHPGPQRQRHRQQPRTAAATTNTSRACQLRPFLLSGCPAAAARRLPASQPSRDACSQELALAAGRFVPTAAQQSGPHPRASPRPHQRPARLGETRVAPLRTRTRPCTGRAPRGASPCARGPAATDNCTARAPGPHAAFQAAMPGTGRAPCHRDPW